MRGVESSTKEAAVNQDVLLSIEEGWIFKDEGYLVVAISSCELAIELGE
jgi:hypothetical protein